MADWELEALPTLQAIYRISERQTASPYVERRDLDAELGREYDDPRTARTLYELKVARLLRVVFETDQSYAPETVELTASGLQQVVRWPISGEEAVGAMLAALSARIDAAASPEERGRLERLRDALRELGTEVAAKLLADVIAGRIPT